MRAIDKSALGVIVACLLSCIAGCLGIAHHIWEYEDAYFFESSEKSIDSITIKMPLHGQCNSIKCIELNGAKLELDDVSPEDFEAFLNEAKIEHERELVNSVTWVGNSIRTYTYRVEGSRVTIFVQDCTFQDRESLSQMTIPGSPQELRETIGKPLKIRTVKSRQP